MSVPTTEEKPVKDTRQQDAGKSIAERFKGREPQLDVVRFSAPWRPFARLLQPKAR